MRETAQPSSYFMLLITVALVVKLRRSPAGVDEVGDDMDLDLETAAAEVFLPD